MPPPTGLRRCPRGSGRGVRSAERRTIQGEMVSLSDSSWYSIAMARSFESWDLAWCRQKSSSPPPGSTTRTYACAPHRSHRSRLVSVGLVVVPVTPSSTVFVGIWFQPAGVTVPSRQNWQLTLAEAPGHAVFQVLGFRLPGVVLLAVVLPGVGGCPTGVVRRRRCRPRPARTCDLDDRRRHAPTYGRMSRAAPGPPAAVPWLRRRRIPGHHLALPAAAGPTRRLSATAHRPSARFRPVRAAGRLVPGRRARGPARPTWASPGRQHPRKHP